VSVQQNVVHISKTTMIYYAMRQPK